MILPWACRIMGAGKRSVSNTWWSNGWRGVALAGAVSGTLLLAVLKWQPSWLKALDQWMVDRYLASESWGGDVPGTTEEQDRLARRFLERAATLQYGDRHYPMWRQSGERLAHEWAGQMRYAEAAELLQTLIETRPNEFALRLKRAEWLLHDGGAKSRQRAQKEVAHVLRRFPTWDRALALETKLAKESH